MADTYKELQRYQNADPDSAPKTRKALLWWLWKHSDHPGVDIVKAGPKYTIMHGATACATGIRCIDNLTLDDWRKAVNDTGAGFCIA